MSVEGNSPTAQKHVAIYMRSAINDREALKAQERTCREHAQKNNWVIEEMFVRSEPGKSGMTPLENRPALQSLMRDAKRQPRPFDILIVDEVSHLSRNIADVFTIADFLAANGICLQVVSPDLNSNDPNFRLMVACCAIVAESYKNRLRNNVRNGVTGRIQMGYRAGGSCFGYRSVAVKDAAHSARVVGHKLEVRESEASTVRRIFALFTTGSSSLQIARKLSDEQVSTHRSSSSWNSTTVGRILRNPVYIGKLTWNKTSQIIHPVTGKRVKRKNPPAMWIVANAPELRIVSSELWDRAQERMKTTKGKLASQEVGQPRSEQATKSTAHEAGALEPEAQPGADSTSDHFTHAGGHFRCAKDGKISNVRICP